MEQVKGLSEQRSGAFHTGFRCFSELVGGFPMGCHAAEARGSRAARRVW